MSFRITTNGMFRNYRTNLQNNTKKLNDSMTRVQTGRAFNSYAEDPAAASKAFQLRRDFWRTGDQIDNSDHVISKFQTGWDVLDSIVDGDSEHPGLSGLKTALTALNDPMGGARQLLGREMITTSESVMMLMNTRYGDEFVFAGADGLNVPFSWSEDGSRLLYRGVDVNTERPKEPSEFGLTAMELKTMEPMPQAEFEKLQALAAKDPADLTDEEQEALSQLDDYDLDAYKTEHPEVTEDYDAYAALYREKNPISEITMEKYTEFTAYKREYALRNGVDYETGKANYEKLQSMAGESTYVDIGLGMKFDTDGKVIPSTAYNSALSGLNFLGYGTDEDGDPQNIIMLMKKLGEVFNNCDPDTGKYTAGTVNGVSYSADEMSEVADRLTKKLEHAVDRVSEQHVKLDAQVAYLRENKSQLEDRKETLNEQIETTEQMEPAEAIMEMSWAQYCYNAALKIGNSILSQSLIDYLD